VSDTGDVDVDVLAPGEAVEGHVGPRDLLLGEAIFAARAYAKAL
jgi:hypothetical protein